MPRAKFPNQPLPILAQCVMRERPLSYRAYARTDAAAGLRWLERAAQLRPQYNFDLFVYAKDPQLDISVTERHAYLEAYLSRVDELESDRNACLAYQRALQALADEGRHAKALEFADRILARSVTDRSRLAYLWRAKAECHRDLQQTTEAKSAFRRCIELSPFSPGGQTIKKNAEKALRELETAMETKGE